MKEDKAMDEGSCKWSIRCRTYFRSSVFSGRPRTPELLEENGRALQIQVWRAFWIGTPFAQELRLRVDYDCSKLRKQSEEEAHRMGENISDRKVEQTTVQYVFPGKHRKGTETPTCIVTSDLLIPFSYKVTEMFIKPFSHNVTYQVNSFPTIFWIFP